MEEILTSDLLKTLFEYKDGNLYWKVKPSSKVNIGDVVGSKDKDGYITTKINSKAYKVHRIIFLMHHDYMPVFIDHIDRNRSNNKIENLREVITHSENLQNKGIYKSNKSGYKNIHWFKLTNSWRVVYKKKHIGYYKQINDAITALESVN